MRVRWLAVLSCLFAAFALALAACGDDDEESVGGGGDDGGQTRARAHRPLLVPELDYERDGFLHDIVFPSGHVPIDGGKRIRIYYGAADSRTAAADMLVADILSSLEPC